MACEARHALSGLRAGRVPCAHARPAPAPPFMPLHNLQLFWQSFVVLRGLCDSPAGQIFHSSPTTPPVARLPRVLWPWKVCRFAPARSVLCSPFSGARKRPFVSSWKTKKAPRTAPFGSDLLQAQRAAAALATRALKPSASAIAISESILRLTVMPALVRPSMKRE